MNDFLKSCLAAICTSLSFIFGDLDGLMIALIALIIIDYITGVVAACVQHKLSSSAGAKGIAKKVFMLAIVAVANIVDIHVIGDVHIFKNVVLIFYVANECISLIENAGRIGVKVPKKLLTVLEQLQKEDNE